MHPVQRRSIFISFLFTFWGFATLLGAADPSQKALVKKIDAQLACDCGCSLTVAACRVSMTCSSSEALDREVTKLVESGMNEKVVLAKMRERHGESILAAPTKEGFNITAWTFPFLALLFGGLVATYYLRKWKNPAEPATPSEAKSNSARTKIDLDYDKRIEEELRKFDA